MGLLPLSFGTDTVRLVPFNAPWWLVVAVLGVVSAAVAYVTGIAGTRRLGARLASFVALMEVVAAAGFAWILLAQSPLPIQLMGAGLVLVGVIVVKMGESSPVVDGAIPTIISPMPVARRRRVFSRERPVRIRVDQA